MQLMYGWKMYPIFNIKIKKANLTYYLNILVLKMKIGGVLCTQFQHGQKLLDFLHLAFLSLSPYPSMSTTNLCPWELKITYFIFYDFTIGIIRLAPCYYAGIFSINRHYVGRSWRSWNQKGNQKKKWDSKMCCAWRERDISSNKTTTRNNE